MKIFLAIIIMIAEVSYSQAQRAASVFFQMPHENISASCLRNVIDTIMPSSFISESQGGLGCFTGIYSSDSGYVTGNNAYGDLEKAQFYDLAHLGYSGTGSIEGVLVKFAYKNQNISPENIVVKIYDADTAGFHPFNLLGTSEPVNVSSIVTNGEYTYFLFDSSVPVSDSFFVSVQLPSSSGDTLVILSTQDGCVGNSGWSWEEWKNGTWHSILTSWIRDIDLAIFPVMDLPFGSGISELLSARVVSVYPNPAKDVTVVHFANEISNPVSACLFSLDGKMVKQFNALEMVVRNNSIVLSLRGINTSLYFLEIKNVNEITRIPLCVIN